MIVNLYFAFFSQDAKSMLKVKHFFSETVAVSVAVVVGPVIEQSKIPTSSLWVSGHKVYYWYKLMLLLNDLWPQNILCFFYLHLLQGRFMQFFKKVLY